MLKHVQKAERNATHLRYPLSPATNKLKTFQLASQFFRKTAANSRILGHNNLKKCL